METYKQMSARHQREINELPIGFAFSNKQFEEMMAKWGLTSTDTDKIYKLGSTGGFYQKKDSKLIKSTLQRHSAEMQQAIESDKTGEGFIYQMFVYELFNHEYGYTGDAEDAVNRCGYELEEVYLNSTMKHALEKACKYVMANTD